MKKLLGISLVAVLAATPLMASARNLTETEMGHAAPVEGDNNKMATVSYVKGAYTELGTVINTKADETALEAETSARTQADTAINNKIGDTTYTGGTLTAAIAQLQSEASGLGSNKVDQEGNFTADTNSNLIKGKSVVAAIQDTAAKVDLNTAAISTETSARETAVSGEATARETADTRLEGLITDEETRAKGVEADLVQDIADETSRAERVEGSLDSLTGNAANATSLVGAINAVDNAVSTLSDAANTTYAKKVGVTQTITNSRISGTVPVVTDWANQTAGTVAIAASITGATYAEPTTPTTGD